jgi:hypothetical protein
MAGSHYNYDPHVPRRLRERGMRGSLQHVKKVIVTATRCDPYEPDDGPKVGGTSWRVTGTNLDGEETTVGVEAYYDTGTRRVLFVTVF